MIEVFSLIDVSIHAPEQGATRLEEWGDKRYVVSIHAPEQGATPIDVGTDRLC